MQFLSIMAKEDYGGSGSTFFSTVLAIEEVAKVEMGLSVLVEVHNNLIIPFFEAYGSDEQKEKYLPRLCKNTVMCLQHRK